MKKISYTSLMLLLCSLVFCSCLSINRSIKLNKDGSGQETIKIIFSKEFYTIMSTMTLIMDSTRKQEYLDSLYNDQIFIGKVKDEYDSIPGVKVADVTSERNSDSSNTFKIKYDFDNIQSIGKAMSNINDKKDDYEISVTWLKEEGNVVFNYNYKEPSINDSISNDSLTEQMKKGMSTMFDGASMHFEIEFPYEVISSNATSASGNTLIWIYTMSDLFSKGSMNLEAVMKEN
ncbi:MAG: hypothetical protein M3R36_02605 [Bacteroidota bacterium]|nr:hypothetical protein [Bacteroidota bacterium]